MLLPLLLTELCYELMLCPARHEQVRFTQAAAISLLLFSGLTMLLLADSPDYQNQAAQEGFAAAGIVVQV